MNRLNRYVMSHVLGMTLITGLALIAIQTLIAYIAELDEVGQGNFGYLALARYILLKVPVGLDTLLPIIAMLGTLLGLGVLASQGELVAMRASGMSILRLGGATLSAGLVLALLAFAVSDWIAPAGQKAAEALKTEAKSGVSTGLGGKPVWLREGPHFYRIDRLIGEDRFADATIYTVDADHRIRRIMAVGQGQYLDGRWVFENLGITEFDAQGTRARREARMYWDGVSPDVLRLYVLEAYSLSAHGMYELIRYLEANGLDASGYRLSLWRKLVALTVMVMMLLAVPFVLGPLRDSGAGQRLMIGILIGLGFYVANEVSASLGALLGWPAALAASAPTMLVAAIALWRLHQHR